jgi:hypothetical protein
MGRSRRWIAAALLVLTLLGSAIGRGENAAAQAPDRETTITIPYTEYEWWLLQWSTDEILCQILVDHEGVPTTSEVFSACGNDIGNAWLSTPPCKNISDGRRSTKNCEGLYLHLNTVTPKTKEVVVELPPPTVWINLEGCTPTPPENRCEKIPGLLLMGEEPLPNEKITSIQGMYAADPFYCEGASCTLPLRPTPLEGVTLEFWANSSFGDSSERYTALIRVVDAGVAAAPGGGGWYVDIISTQWRGADLTSCQRTWQAFPPLGGAPLWLSTPDHSLLASDAPYYYLAGRLIVSGEVDASSCATGGLLPNGYADACGLELARPQVMEWQNQFDARLTEVASETTVPGQLLKNLFAQESQFWPGVFRVPYEFGLGQITDNGTDALLLWNEPFYDQFCPLVLTEETCSGGYLHLSNDDKAMLRGALALQVKADCPTCTNGIDLTNVDFSLGFFAQTILANCEQVGQIVTNATQQIPGAVASYEDLWRLTVANYHAGPGCLSYAVYTAWQNDGNLLWPTVAQQFTAPCKGVVPYVEKITR